MRMHIEQHDIDILYGYYTPVEFTIEGYKDRICEVVSAGSNNTLTIHRDPGIHTSYLLLSIGSTLSGLVLRETD